MSDLLIQIVDEHEDPVGSATMADVHQKGLFRRIVYVLAGNPIGQLLLQKRELAMSMHRSENVFERYF